jgi:signal peptidase II
MNDRPDSSGGTVPVKAAGPLAFPPLPVFWLLVSAVVIVLDLYTKRLASESLLLYRPHEVFSWLNMTLAHNYGAAFSFLSSAGGWQRGFFIALASVVSVVLLVWLIRLPRREWLTGLGLALVLGGAVGNLVDRVKLGYVVDFIDVHFKGWHYPAFNVADSAITCGVALLVVDVFVISMRSKDKD